jgi:hypothetical protein
MSCIRVAPAWRPETQSRVARARETAATSSMHHVLAFRNGTFDGAPAALPHM